MAMIAFVSHRPLPAIAGGPPDWLLHGIEYAFLSATCVYGATRGFDAPYRDRRQIVVGVMVATLYGAIDEWHQGFVPARDMSLTDWIADAVGAILTGVALMLLWQLYKRVDSKKPVGPKASPGSGDLTPFP